GRPVRRPVHQPLGPVDRPVVVQLLEDRLDGAGEPLVHGEALAGPVDAVTHAAHLGQDGPAVLLLPLPHALDEGFPAEVAVVDALVPQLLSTSACTAMLAWSIPGSHSVSYPCMRRRRISRSIRVCS